MTQKKPLNKKHLIRLLIWVILLLFVAVIWINISHIIGYFFTDKTASSKNTTPKHHQSVIYPVNDWQISKKSPSLTIDELIELIGTNPTTDDTLDFYGNHAKLYRFSSLAEPVFSVIDGDGVVEINWYFAHAKDQDGDKAKSLIYAQKTYAAVGHIYGTDAKALLIAMLNQKPAPKLTGLLLAQCTGYTCQLILDKKALHITTKTAKD